ncbi:MAG: NTP transferase domain-containing protein [Xanthomonadales bacterium]|nr:nucleotidyltransferase family protein [Gammaproteobacteria bacterium]MBT8052676.1 nucleotidyltransferase family protein [Gammaproteobacteria bacterium]NND56803.1 NTP transferase domain-containing protein [Xanthomonadales bacterium]NNK50666.1 NTP transferase domain-containing protein [Xanthomonadales bacterium]
MDAQFSAVVLAGERPGGSDFARQLGLAASVLVDVAGKSALQRVLDALDSSASVNGGLLCGPEESVFRKTPEIQEILIASSFEWMPPATGPSASALAGVEQLNHFPVLLTAGDHALLTPALIDQFCAGASELGVDIALGLVPYEVVRAAFPESKRTVLKFRDGHYCGSNLFAIMNSRGKAGPAFWTKLESDRKKPWRMVRHAGVGLLVQYLLGRLTLDKALDTLSRAMGCSIGYALLDNPRAAVDVDSAADRDLAVKILQSG